MSAIRIVAARRLIKSSSRRRPANHRDGSPLVQIHTTKSAALQLNVHPWWNLAAQKYKHCVPRQVLQHGGSNHQLTTKPQTQQQHHHITKIPYYWPTLSPAPTQPAYLNTSQRCPFLCAFGACFAQSSMPGLMKAYADLCAYAGPPFVADRQHSEACSYRSSRGKTTAGRAIKLKADGSFLSLCVLLGGPEFLFGQEKI